MSQGKGSKCLSSVTRSRAPQSQHHLLLYYILIRCHPDSFSFYFTSSCSVYLISNPSTNVPCNLFLHITHRVIQYELASFQWATNNSFSSSFRFLSSCVSMTFDNFSKLPQLPSVGGWVADGSRGPRLNSAVESGCVRLCECVAVTHRASWEAAAILMDAKERQREEGRERREARPSGRRVPVLQHCRSDGRWMSMEWKKKMAKKTKCWLKK